jgi:hypothetical protein
MSGGKGGSKTTETTIPAWIRDPAIRNLARAEDVQRIPYMPYYGADVAAFTPTQNAAFQSNINAAEAFGLLAPNTLTPTSGMPTPTDFDGFTGYSSQPMYESALAELRAKQGDAVAQYDRLFGGSVPTTWGNNPRFRGSAAGGGGGGNNQPQVHTTSGFGDTLNLGGGDVTPAQALDQLNADRSKIIQKNPDGSFVNVLGTGDAEGRNYWGATTVADDTSPFTTDVSYTSPPKWDLSPGHPSNRGKY